MNRLKGIRNTSDTMVDPDVIFCDSKMGFYNIKNYKGEQFDLDFAVRSISKIARYVGHTGKNPESFYSVAQHSVKMAESALIALGDVNLAKECLFHDLIGEPFIGDIMSPLKLMFKKDIDIIESKIESINSSIVGISYPLDSRVKKIDLNIAEYEMTFMVGNCDTCNNEDFWSPKKSYEEFYKMINRIETLETYNKKELKTEMWSHRLFISGNNEPKIKKDIDEIFKEYFVNLNSDLPLQYYFSYSGTNSKIILDILTKELDFSFAPNVDNDTNMDICLIDLSEKVLLPSFKDKLVDGKYTYFIVDHHDIRTIKDNYFVDDVTPTIVK